MTSPCVGHISLGGLAYDANPAGWLDTGSLTTHSQTCTPRAPPAPQRAPDQRLEFGPSTPTAGIFPTSPASTSTGVHVVHVLPVLLTRRILKEEVRTAGAGRGKDCRHNVHHLHHVHPICINIRLTA